MSVHAILPQGNRVVHLEFVKPNEVPILRPIKTIFTLKIITDDHDEKR